MAEPCTSQNFWPLYNATSTSQRGTLLFVHPSRQKGRRKNYSDSLRGCLFRSHIIWRKKFRQLRLLTVQHFFLEQRARADRDLFIYLFIHTCQCEHRQTRTEVSWRFRKITIKNGNICTSWGRAHPHSKYKDTIYTLQKAQKDSAQIRPFGEYLQLPEEDRSNQQEYERKMRK